MTSTVVRYRDLITLRDVENAIMDKADRSELAQMESVFRQACHEITDVIGSEGTGSDQSCLEIIDDIAEAACKEITTILRGTDNG